MNTDEVNQSTVYIYDGVERKASKKFQISSQITSLFFIKGFVLFTGFDEIYIVKTDSMEVEYFLKTSANVGYCISSYLSEKKSLLAFRSQNNGKNNFYIEKVIIFDTNLKIEHEFKPFEDDSKINFLEFNREGKVIAVADEKARYIAIYDIITLEQKKLFHRGHMASDIKTISFSKHMNYCAVLSCTGTLHVFSFGDEVSSKEKKPVKVVKAKLGRYFDYFKSEQSFGSFKTKYRSKGQIERSNFIF